MTRLGEVLVESRRNALAHARGEASSVRLHTIKWPDVLAIRRKLRMSQLAFAETYWIPLSTLKS